METEKLETGVEDGCKVQRNQGEGDRGRLRQEAKKQGRRWGENRKEKEVEQPEQKQKEERRGEEED